MTTYAPSDGDRVLEELAARERDAWNAYRERLRDVDDRSYDEVELESWEELQRVLRELAAERAGVSLLGPPQR